MGDHLAVPPPGGLLAQSDLRCRLRLAGQPAQYLQVGGVWALAVESRDLQDERLFGQPGIVEKGSEAGLADLPLADVGMSIAVGAEPGLRVVAVNGHQALEPDHTMPLVQGAARRIFGP